MSIVAPDFQKLSSSAKFPGKTDNVSSHLNDFESVLVGRSNFLSQKLTYVHRNFIIDSS